MPLWPGQGGPWCSKEAGQQGPLLGRGEGQKWEGVLEQGHAAPQTEKPKPAEGRKDSPSSHSGAGQGDRKGWYVVELLEEEGVGGEGVPGSFQTTLKLSHREAPSGVAHRVQVTSSIQESKVQSEAFITEIMVAVSESQALTTLQKSKLRHSGVRSLNHSCTAS